MSKKIRHAKILELISKQEIATQEELCKALIDCHISVTQATVSRDIQELRLFKVTGTQKRFRYAAIGEEESGITNKMRALFQTCVVNIQAVNNLIVIKTLNGNAANAGAAVDRLDFQEVAGSIAGDDTLLLICKSNEEAIAVQERLNQML